MYNISLYAEGRDTVNRYKKLFSTTFILGIGTFSSKLLTFLLVPLYTHVLTKGEYGIVDLLVQTANLLIPLVSLGINEGILRFGIDDEIDHRAVFTSGFVTIFIGFGAFCLLYPAVRLLPIADGYTPWIYVFVLCSMLHYLCARFTKALGHVRLYAASGVLGTALTLLFDLLFLLVFQWGILGYILAIVLSDVGTILFLTVTAKLYRYLRFAKLDKAVWRAMLKYSVPLIPTTVLWWVTDVSDRYIVKAVIGADANGLYAVSYKIPTIMILFCGIFMDAWQLSVLSEKSRLERQQFFSRVFSMYQSVMFLSASGLIVFAKVITKILVAEAFYESWRYIPVLIIATVFSCLVTFLGSIYVVEKRSKSTLWTTVLGAVANIIGNLLLIPVWGVQGAAISTAASYALVFAVRALHSRRLIPMQWDLPRFLFNLAVVCVQAAVMVAECRGWMIIEAALLTLVLAVNFKTLWQAVLAVVGSKKGKTA